MQSLKKLCDRFKCTTNKIYFSSSAPEIVIPPRIERGPTDILAALAGTVGKDMTAPHYRYHDDPWLIPYKIVSRREYTLSKEAGKNAAKFIMANHLDLFEQNRIEAEPASQAFTPRHAYNKDNVTLELLENLVSSFQVQDSITVYSLLVEKKKEIPPELRQNLLELVAYYNESDATEDGDETRGIMIPENSKWISDGFVANMYSEGGTATPGERMAMLLGSGKYGSNVWKLLSECKANGDNIPVEAYNYAIQTMDIDNGVATTVGKIKEVLVEMRDSGIAPTQDTLIAILNKITHLTHKGKEYEVCCRRALDFMAEFRVLGIKFSLGVYNLLMQIYKPKSLFNATKHKTPIVNSILDELEEQEMWPASCLEDFYFFPTAMRICNVQNNLQTAWRLDRFLNSGKNSLLLSDFQFETNYYTNFLSVVLQNDEFETTMKLYNDLVPHTCTPMYNFFAILLKALHTNGAIHHLPKIWEDLVVSNFGSASRENQYMLTYSMMQVLSANDHNLFELTGMSEVYNSISEQVFHHLEANIANKHLYLRFNKLASSICDNIILVALREANFDLASRVIKFCADQKNVMPGQLKSEPQSQFLDVCLDLEEIEKAIQVVEYSVDVKSTNALALGLKLANVGLNDDQKAYLNKLFATYSEWTNL